VWNGKGRVELASPYVEPSVGMMSDTEVRSA